MNQEQEIRAKALEIAVELYSALLQQGRIKPEPPKTMEEFIIDISKPFESHIKG